MLKKLTLSELAESRPDLVKALADQERGKLEEAKTVERLRAEVKKLTEDLTAEKKKVDEYQLKEQVAERERKLLALIDESKIDKQYITTVFMNSLRVAKDDDEVKKMLEDRAKLIVAGAGGVRGMGDDRPALRESREKPASGNTPPASKAQEPSEYEEAVKEK
jgi:hypothetical protein